MITAAEQDLLREVDEPIQLISPMLHFSPRLNLEASLSACELQLPVSEIQSLGNAQTHTFSLYACTHSHTDTATNPHTHTHIHSQTHTHKHSFTHAKAVESSPRVFQQISALNRDIGVQECGLVNMCMRSNRNKVSWIEKKE